MNHPIDHEIRQQVMTDLGASIALSAGAGSGKTTVLSQRTVNLLESGVDPSKVAAITFTEKAAGELQTRVREGLEQRHETAKGETKARLADALDRFHEVTISTIHSFCRGLLAAEPLESQWAPGTDVVESDRSGLSDAVTQWEYAIRARDHRLGVLFDVLLPPKSRNEGIDDLLNNRDLNPVTAGADLDWNEAHEELREIYEEILEARKACLSPDE
ncbi:MAG: UvrD-helicase domain-containing protein, partial [Planctomycetota bacterium]